MREAMLQLVFVKLKKDELCRIKTLNQRASSSHTEILTKMGLYGALICLTKPISRR
jgi:hypothetical protein